MISAGRRAFKTWLLLPCLLSAALAASCASQDDDDIANVEATEIPLKPGLWETTVTFTDIKAMSLGDRRKADLKRKMAESASSISCLSAEEAQKPQADFFGGARSHDCKYRKFDVSRGDVNIRLSCDMEAMAMVETDLQGKASPRAFDLDMDMKVRLPIIGKVELKGDAKGKYMGACPGRG